MKHNKKVILAILDGWGIGKPDKYNAIANANTPNFDRLVRLYPNTSLKSDGTAVGLPEGQSGTSEINHQVIGSGRVILQDLPRIDQEITNKTFYTNQYLVKACRHAVENNSSLHLIGIVSDGGVHSCTHHLFSLIDLAVSCKVPHIYIHAFADGRDTPPISIEKYLKKLDKHIKNYPNVSLATLQGRYWLDRDRDWAKTQTALELISKGIGRQVNNWNAALNLSYNQNVTDEFFHQFLIDPNGIIKANDSIIFTHYRTDRLYQLVKSTIDLKLKNSLITTFIQVSEEFRTVNVAFPRQIITSTLAEVISANNRKQLHITETEKYTHLTYFFNGAKEQEYEGEKWELISSNRFIKPFYSLEPSMQSFNIASRVIDAIHKNEYDFIVINFASPDMVGHTGNYNAAVISAEAVDYCLGKIYDAIKDQLNEYSMIVTADHGNSEEMWDYENKQPHTQHTLNPVPLILVSDINTRLKQRESLEDIAPTVLDLMGLKSPDIFTGTSLIKETK
jgi:2,3-bisphosphoglycerate-independent phosphoglycerate mutase